MLEFWAVMGRMCLDPEFHQQLFERADHTAPFEDLEKLSVFLRIDNRLTLGRGEIVSINRIVSGNHSGGDFQPHASFADDREVAAIREGLKLRPLSFPEDLAFCAAFGLAGVDRAFRAFVVGSASSERLLQELARPALDHPMLALTAAEAEEVRAMVRTKEEELTIFHQANWIIPEQVACDGGFSLDARFLAVSQPDAIALLMRSPEKFDELFEARVIQGNRAVLKQTFVSLAQEARMAQMAKEAAEHGRSSESEPAALAVSSHAARRRPPAGRA